MDIEEIKQFLNTDEGKKLVEESEAVNGLRSKRDELLSKQSQLSNQLKTYSSFGDTETIAKAMELYSKTVEKEDEQKKVDPKLQSQLEHLTNELNKERELRTNREKAMVKSHTESQVLDILTKHKGDPELIKYVIFSRIDSNLDENGKIHITVKNQDGSPMFKNGNEATLEDLVNEFKSHPSYSKAFESTIIAGSGTKPTSNVKSKTVVDFDSKDFNLTEYSKKLSNRK